MGGTWVCSPASEIAGPDGERDIRRNPRLLDPSALLSGPQRLPLSPMYNSLRTNLPKGACLFLFSFCCFLFLPSLSVARFVLFLFFILCCLFVCPVRQR